MLDPPEDPELTGHCWHADALNKPTNVPAAQGTHAEAPEEAEKVPGWQFKQKVSFTYPDPVPYFPTAHPMHADKLVAFPNVPAGHRRHEVATETFE